VSTERSAIPKKRFLKYALLGIATICITLYAAFYRELSVVFSFFILYFAGRFLVKKNAEGEILLFEVSFLINVLAAIFLTMIFRLEHGDPYTGMGDDMTIYEIARDFKNGITRFAGDLSWNGVNYKTYVIVLSGWLRLLNLVGFSSDFFFNLNILNCWMGAFIAPVVCNIFKHFTSERNSRSIGWLALLYPLSIYFSANIIRDTVVTLFFALGVLVTLDTSLGRMKKVLYLAVVTFLLYNLRDVSGLFLVTFICSFLAINLIANPVKYFVKVSVLIVLGFAFSILLAALAMSPPKVLPPLSDFMNHLSFRIHFYNDLALSTAGESLGAQLRQSRNPVLIGLSLPHLFFSPAPPRFFYGLTASNIVMGVGNIMWYFFGFAFLLSAINLPNHGRLNSFWWSLFLTALTSLLIINFTSGDVRHFAYLHPLLMGLAYMFLSKHPMVFNITFKIFAGFLAFLTALYIFLKFG
jgi:hypothetical protein